MIMKKFKFSNGEFILDGKARIMGILNVTPDSFSDGGMFFDAENAVCHAEKMLSDGADIIDVGAMSTRPGSAPISSDEEIQRLAPVLKKLCRLGSAVISVDTVNPETAEFALSAGAHIINDVSGHFNEKMASVVKSHNAGWILTHTANVPSGDTVEYKNGVVCSVNEFFDEVIDKCEKIGIGREYICLDPGFGFAKTTEDNIQLLKNLESVVRDDVAFLAAASRKRFIADITNAKEIDERLEGSLAVNIIALMKGSDFIRVHDVKETKRAISIYNSII